MRGHLCRVVRSKVGVSSLFGFLCPTWQAPGQAGERPSVSVWELCACQGLLILSLLEALSHACSVGEMCLGSKEVHRKTRRKVPQDMWCLSANGFNPEP